MLGFVSRSWACPHRRGRIDDIEVQVHLGSLDLRDQLTPVIEDLRDAWLDASAKVSDSTDTASDVLGTLRTGLESAMDEIRKAVSEARSTVTE